MSVITEDSTHTVLSGIHVRLEPLARAHVPGLVAAARRDPGLALYQWTAVPLSVADMAQYVDTAISWREAGTALPFATVRSTDGTVIGSTRFFDIERWAWPVGHPQAARAAPDGCEIGYTWLAGDAIRTAANTEAKLLMLTHAFESWRRAARVFPHRRAQRALTLGARAHRGGVRGRAARAPSGSRPHPA